MNDLDITEPLPVARPEKPDIAVMTPQQARVDAVAALTTIAISKAATLELTQDETNRLVAEFADADFRTGAAGKEQLLYLEHAALRDRLNSVLGLGQWAIIVRESWNEDFVSPKGTKGVRVYCRGMMLIRGCYVSEAVGDMDYFPGNAAQNYGDAFEGATTAAFRRCAKQFGVGLQAWRKDWCEGWWQRKQGKAIAAPSPAPKPAPQPRPAPTPKPVAPAAAEPLTTAQRREKLLAALRGYEPEANAVFRENALVLDTEQWTEISDFTLDRIQPANLMALIKETKQRKSDSDQVPGAEPASEDLETAHQNELEAPDEPEGTLGTVEEVNVKPGKTKTGKAWVKYGIKIDGGWFNTFSETDYKTAASLKGEQCRYVGKVTQYGHDLVSIEAVGEVTP